MTTQTKTYAPERRHYSPSASVVFRGSPRDWAIGAILALSLIVNAVAIHSWMTKETEERVSQYNFDFWARQEFAPLKARVEAQEALITATLCKKIQEK